MEQHYAMLDRIIEQQTTISAVLAESKRAVDRDMILTSGELAVMECMIGVLKPLAQATGGCTENANSLK